MNYQDKPVNRTKRATNNPGKLENLIGGSEFRLQLGCLGKDVFSMFLDLYFESKISSESSAIFPQDKKEAFKKVAAELSANNGNNMKRFYNCFGEFDDKPVKDLLGREYQGIMKKKEVVIKESSYDALYTNFINAQANDLFMEMEGDRFFYIKDRKFKYDGKDSERIWVFAKVVELLYEKG